MSDREKISAEDREAASLDEEAVSAHSMKAEAASAERSAPEDREDDDDVELHSFKHDNVKAE